MKQEEESWRCRDYILEYYQLSVDNFTVTFRQIKRIDLQVIDSEMKKRIWTDRESVINVCSNFSEFF